MKWTTANDTRREQRIQERQSVIDTSKARLERLKALAMQQPDMFERAFQKERKFFKYVKRQQEKDEACQ